jgi:hypothetical protein
MNKLARIADPRQHSILCDPLCLNALILNTKDTKGFTKELEVVFRQPLVTSRKGSQCF